MAATLVIPIKGLGKYTVDIPQVNSKFEEEAFGALRSKETR